MPEPAIMQQLALALLLSLIAVPVAARGPDPGPAGSGNRMKQTLPYPATRATDTRDTLFGVPVADPYRWLEDVRSPEVRAWMDAQNRLARQRLAELPGREFLTRRLRELFYIDTISAP